MSSSVETQESAHAVTNDRDLRGIRSVFLRVGRIVEQRPIGAEHDLHLGARSLVGILGDLHDQAGVVGRRIGASAASERPAVA